MEFNEVVKKRASIRNYASKKFDISIILELIETANLAPSPGNLPIIRYIIVDEENKISAISEACQQPFIAHAPYVLVICSNSKDCNMLYDSRSKKYISQHAGATIENLLLKVTDMGLACCWVGAFDERTLKDLFDIPDNIDIEAVLPIGYPPATDRTKQKIKGNLNTKRIWYNNWKVKFYLKPSKVRREDV